MRNSLNVPGILNIIVSFFWLIGGMNESVVSLSIGVYALVSGVVCLMYSKLNTEDLFEKKGVVLAFAITSLPINLLSSIFLFAEYDKIKGEYYKYLKEKDMNIVDAKNSEVKVEKEVKKLDILLKLGIAMVAVSGIMIATTSWDIITDFVKMILFIFIGIVFLGLSYFSDKKLKIKSTTITYWMLSMISFGLSVFMLGYYQFLGDWFSINGEGNNIFMSVFVLIISLFSYITYKKFDLKSFLYGTFLGIVISLTLAINFISEDIELSLCVLTIILAAINFLPKTENKEFKFIKVFSMIASFVLTALLIVQIQNVESPALVAITAIVQIVNLITIALTQKNDSISVLSAIGILGIIVVTINSIVLDLNYIYANLLNKSIYIISAIIICLAIIKNNKKNNILLAVVLPFTLISLLFEIDIVVALYIGIVAFLMIVLGFINKEYKTIYIEGIIFTIANLIIQLWEFWGLLPIWAYLLLGGLSLIGIVTYKELKK